MTNGFAYSIRRNPEMGSLNGYVGVPAGHPWFGKGYDAIEARVHGGITYAGPVLPMSWHYTAFHCDGLWWVGFDCGHAFDAIPLMLGFMEKGGLERFDLCVVYRDIAYVRAECESLAEQARAAVENPAWSQPHGEA